MAANTNGGGVSGTNSLWFGGAGSRFATTRGVNAFAGGAINFSLRMADGADYPWEAADLPGEGVVLEYSVNGGTNWSTLLTLNGVTNAQWTSPLVTLPIAARSTNTLFRWRQLANSGASFDHWALDDVNIAIPTPPAITGPPLDHITLQGANATFDVAATGSAPLRFQWQFNGVNLAGQTNAILDLPGAYPTNAGSYAVVVNNPAGTAPGSPASLGIFGLGFANEIAQFSIAGPLGNQYRVEYRDSLSDTNWSVLTNLSLSASPTILADTNSQVLTNRVYRLIQLP